MKFTESALENAFLELLQEQDYTYEKGEDIPRNPSEVLIKEDLKTYLRERYKFDQITEVEIDGIIRHLETFPASDLYESNKAIMKFITDGYTLKREDRSKKDLHIELVDFRKSKQESASSEALSVAAESSEAYSEPANIFKAVNQFEIIGFEKRIPDVILFINGLPLVVVEFKSAIREEATIFNAYEQLTIRYKRDIPELFKYNAFCIISDGANNKAGSFFAKYDFFYAWRKINPEDTKEVDGIASLHTMVKGMLDKNRLYDIIHHFIMFPDASKKDEKIVCRYPQYYAATKLFNNILNHQKPEGDGKGGTYFGATGCGKSYTMLFLTRLLMKSVYLSSPTIILITDRTDLDDQLSGQFTNAKRYIGDDQVISVETRDHLKELLQGRNSGGVFLTTIHKFTEATDLLTDRTNVICISDEAHRSQINLDQKLKITKDGVTKTFGFAKYLHDSLPNATYVGFTGTPIDATMDVFGEIVDSYTMTESVKDEITVRIVYEGRAAKVILNNQKLKEIEAYYAQCAEDGSSEHQIEQSKKASAQMNAIIGDPDRIKEVANDFIKHYEERVYEGSTVKGKAMFVCSTRPIAYELYKEIISQRPDWAEIKIAEEGAVLTEKEKREIKPMPRVQMVMTRNQDDPKELYDLLGTKDDRKELDRQFKEAKSNFKIAIVVDMWLTGFDVPFLDTIYIDKPIKRHNLIQTISRVNRKFEGKPKGLVVDYIGIKTEMNKALAHYSKVDGANFEEIEHSVNVVKDQLDLLSRLFHTFDDTSYFEGSSVNQLNCLNNAVEFVQMTKTIENRFLGLVKRLKAAYDICCGSEEITTEQRDYIHFYLAIRSIVIKLTRGNAPDTAQMNARVREMISEALKSDGVEEIFKIGEEKQKEFDLFDEEHLARLEKIKLPNTKMKLLIKLLSQALDNFKKINKAKGTDFSKQMKAIVDKYNERKEQDTFRGEVVDDFSNEIIELYRALLEERKSFGEKGIDIEEKAFYDILFSLCKKYDFSYPEDKLIVLASEVKKVVNNIAKYADWNKKEDTKAELRVELLLLLKKHNYPPVDKDEVYKEIFEQAENLKRYKG